MNNNEGFDMELIAFTITPNNRKVVAFIKHFDLPVEVRQIDFKRQEHKGEEFTALNPMQKVPVLVDGDFVLWESNAILAYLAAKFPQTHALPGEPQKLADVNRWMHWQNAHLMPAMGGIKTGDKTEEDVRPLLAILDGQLAGKEYLTGEMTIADFAVAAYVLTTNADKFDYSDFPNLAAWRERIGSLPAFEETAFKLPPAAA